MRMIGKLIYGAVVIALLAGLVYYANPAQVAATLAGADPLLVAIGFLLGVASLLVRVKKWAVLLHLPFRKTAVAQIVGVMISNFTPGKIAEPVKAVILKKQAAVDVSKSLPSIFWERVIDLIVVMILSLFVFAALPLGGNLQALSISGMVIFGFIALLAIAVIYSQFIGRKIFWIARKFPLLNRISDGFIDNFYSVRVRKRGIGKCFFWTAAAWLLDSVAFYVAFLALGLEPLPVLLLAGIMSLSIIIAIASTLPGGIGSFEIVSTVLLGVAGIASATAVSVVLLVRLMTLWLSVGVGMTMMVHIGRKLDIFDAMNTAKTVPTVEEKTTE